MQYSLSLILKIRKKRKKISIAGYQSEIVMFSHRRMFNHLDSEKNIDSSLGRLSDLIAAIGTFDRSLLLYALAKIKKQARKANRTYQGSR